MNLIQKVANWVNGLTLTWNWNSSEYSESNQVLTKGTSTDFKTFWSNEKITKYVKGRQVTTSNIHAHIGVHGYFSTPNDYSDVVFTGGHNHTNNYRCYRLGAPVYTGSTMTAGDIYELRIDSGSYEFYVNGVLLYTGLTLDYAEYRAAGFSYILNTEIEITDAQ